MTMEMQRVRALILTVLAAGTFGGCVDWRGVQGEPDDHHRLHGWLGRTEEVVGVLPPREDVRVADVHVYLSDPDGAERLTLYATPRWANLPAADRMAEEYRRRPAYPPTPAEYIETRIENAASISRA